MQKQNAAESRRRRGLPEMPADRSRFRRKGRERGAKGGRPTRRRKEKDGPEDGDGAMGEARNAQASTATAARAHGRRRANRRKYPRAAARREKKALVLPGRVMTRQSGMQPTFVHGPSPAHLREEVNGAHFTAARMLKKKNLHCSETSQTRLPSGEIPTQISLGFQSPSPSAPAKAVSNSGYLKQRPIGSPQQMGHGPKTFLLQQRRQSELRLASPSLSGPPRHGVFALGRGERRTHFWVSFGLVPKMGLAFGSPVGACFR